MRERGKEEERKRGREKGREGERMKEREDIQREGFNKILFNILQFKTV